MLLPLRVLQQQDIAIFEVFNIGVGLLVKSANRDQKVSELIITKTLELLLSLTVFQLFGSAHCLSS